MSEVPWFVLTTDAVRGDSHNTGNWRKCDTYKKAVAAAKGLIRRGQPLVYIAHGVNECKPQFHIVNTVSLVERKPNVEGVSDEE